LFSPPCLMTWTTPRRRSERQSNCAALDRLISGFVYRKTVASGADVPEFIRSPSKRRSGGLGTTSMSILNREQVSHQPSGLSTHRASVCNLLTHLTSTVFPEGVDDVNQQHSSGRARPPDHAHRSSIGAPQTRTHQC